MEITLVGDVGIRARESGWVHLQGAQVRVVFAVLALERRHGVDRDSLAEAVWPDRLPTTWPSALRSVVSRVRAFTAAALPARHQVLALRAGRYVLDLPPDAAVDVEVGERAVEAARRALRAGRHLRARHTATEAVARLRAPFLPGCHGDWVAGRRAHLGELVVAGLEVAAHAAITLADGAGALIAATEAVGRAPLRESAHQSLMAAHAAAGNRGEALRAYHRLRRVLGEELGIDPSPETEALYLDLLAPTPHALPAVPAAPPPAGPGDAGEVDGRWEAELEVLGDAWRRAAARERNMVLVTGPAGVGKSRLAVEVARRASAAGGVVLVGRCGPGSRTPYRPFLDPLDGLAAATPDDELPTEPRARAELARLLPSLGASPLDPVPTSPALFEAVTALVAGATADRPALVVLDDLHVAPADTFALLHHVVREAEGARLLVVAAARDTPGAAGPLEAMAGSLERSDLLRRLPLAPAGGAAHGTGPAVLSTGASRRAAPARVPAPAAATRFVGRHREAERVLAALRASPLVTVTGPGGVGKSRLAREVAGRARLGDHPDGLRYCDVSAAPGAAGLVEHVAEALGVAPVELVAALRATRLLLVLDGCERLRAPVAELVGEALAGGAGQGTRFLVTSRAPLRAGNEQVVPVRPLAPPDAVALLADRARAAGAEVHTRDPSLARIAGRLDGLPLALELVAGRLATMPVDAVAARIERPFDLVPGLRATVGRSVDPLGPEHRRLLAALSVFRGGCDHEAAEAILPAAGLDAAAVAPLMAELAEQSLALVDARPGGPSRYVVLATTGARAAEDLAVTGRRPALDERHAAHFVALAERAAAHRRGPDEAEWVARIDADLDNLRAAFRWSMDAGRPAHALRLVVALADDVLMRERREVGHWAEEAAGHPAVADDRRRPTALGLASTTALAEGRRDDTVRLAVEALAAERRSGAPPCWIVRNALAILTSLGLARRVVDARWDEQLESVAEIGRASGDPLAGAVVHYHRALACACVGDHERGERTAEALLTLAATTGNPTVLAMGLLARGTVAADRDPVAAVADHRRAGEVAAAVRNTLLEQRARRGAEEIAARTGDRMAALRSLRSLARSVEVTGNLCEQVGIILTMLDSLVALGALGPAATICAALARTPWRHTVTHDRLDRAIAGGLPRRQYLAARQAGDAMSPTELVAYAFTQVDERVAAGPATG